MRLGDVQLVHKADNMLDPALHGKAFNIIREIGVSEAQSVRRIDMEMLGKIGDDTAPIGKGGDPRTRSVDQD